MASSFDGKVVPNNDTLIRPQSEGVKALDLGQLGSWRLGSQRLVGSWRVNLGFGVNPSLIQISTYDMIVTGGSDSSYKHN